MFQPRRSRPKLENELMSMTSVFVSAISNKLFRLHIEPVCENYLRSVRMCKECMYKHPQALMCDVCHDEHGSFMSEHATCDWLCQCGQRAVIAGEQHLLSLQG